MLYSTAASIFVSTFFSKERTSSNGFGVFSFAKSTALFTSMTATSPSETGLTAPKTSISTPASTLFSMDFSKAFGGSTLASAIFSTKASTERTSISGLADVSSLIAFSTFGILVVVEAIGAAFATPSRYPFNPLVEAGTFGAGGTYFLTGLLPPI